MDNSFISLYPTLYEAHLASNNPDGSTINLNNYVQLSPDEAYLQTSNSKVPIEMAMGDYTAELIKDGEVVLADVTDRVFVYESTNSQTGIAQISFEMINLPPYYGQAVHLKLTQITNTDNVFYSTAFCISPDTTGTVRLDYKGTGSQFGVDYLNAPFFQSIRVQGRFRKINPVTNAQTYDQSSGARIAQRFTRVLASEFVIEYINNQGNLALSAVEQLGVVYVNGQRANSVQYSTDEVLGNSNFYAGKLTAFLNPDETYTPTYQIALPFAPVSLSPFGVYTLAGLPTLISAILNRPVTTGTGTLEVWNKTTGFKIATYTAADVNLFGSSFSIDITGLITTNGEYYIIERGLLLSRVFNERYDTVADSVHGSNWWFKVGDADWLAGDWLSGDWFTG